VYRIEPDVDLAGVLTGSDAFGALVKALDAAPRGGAVAAGGLWGASGALLASALACVRPGVWLLVAPGVDEADRLEEDLETFTRPHTASVRVLLFPAWDVLPTESEEPDSATLLARAEVAAALGRERGEGESLLIVANPIALLQGSPAGTGGEALAVDAGGVFDLEARTEWLVTHGYERAHQVSRPGEFARRGGLLDVYPYFASAPVRVELAGDRVESLRRFDPMTQRSAGEVWRLEVPPLDRGRALDKPRLLPELLAAVKARAIEFEPAEAKRCAALYLASFTGDAGTRLVAPGALRASLDGLARVRATALAPDVHGAVDFGARSVQRLERREVGAALRALLELSARAERTVLYASSQAERDRIAELLASAGLEAPASLTLALGRLSGAFELPGPGGIVAVSDAELFGRRRDRSRARPAAPSAPLETVADLEPGELVVHRIHGVARYLGMERFERRGKTEDYLALGFAENAKLYVPAVNVAFVGRYIGPEKSRPDLSRLGGTAWERKKARAREAARAVVDDLVRLEAAREASSGIVYPPDDEAQRAFEAAFPYEETRDQLKAVAAIKADMERPSPMDRLLCGDVGFGKTEVALRACFKAIFTGRQVALLVPTTVLAEQHERTFRERLAGYPVHVESLSRLRSAREQHAVIEGLASGEVDVVIGTHRLFSGDVRFRDLGLVVVDEEQRFGVEDKERLKTLRVSVDVLTLTATPIPRTLHMALVGLRDISALSTPPADRLAIRTKIVPWSGDLVRRAILREMARGGQVYFVHNRVESIRLVAERLARLVPEARCAVAHGQMAAGAIERAMGRFVRGEADVLVATTLVENGLDIPHANTIFIDRADCLGLAELHQLRGRVGRYRHRAYAYLLVPPVVSTLAAKRLKAIEEFDELGAGYRLALRDLELRGAGNVLGLEQSGHIAEVGYELYCRLVEESADAARGTPREEPIEVTLNLGTSAYLPDAYIPGAAAKLEAYRRLAAAADDVALARVREEFEDRYGPLPPEAERLLREAKLRAACGRARVSYLGLENGRFVLKLHRWRLARLERRLAGLEDIRLLNAETFTVPAPRASAEGLARAAEDLLARLEGKGRRDRGRRR